jgi:hypothetical protein
MLLRLCGDAETSPLFEQAILLADRSRQHNLDVTTENSRYPLVYLSNVVAQARGNGIYLLLL